MNWKGTLLEYCSKQFPVIDCVFKSEESGPDHAKVFTTSLVFDQKVFTSDRAKTKKLAEQSCAEKVLGYIDDNKTIKKNIGK